MEISQLKIEELAHNAEANKKGLELAKKNKFKNLKISADKNLIWGECEGSGKNPYYCSADFVEANAPVFRCNCPSRQIPCKHAIGLLHSYVTDNKAFTEDEIPEDIRSKREKIEKRQEKKTQEKETIKEKAEKPKKVNTASFIKKIDTQLAGIQIAQKISKDIVQTGLSSIDSKLKRVFQEQIKELGNYYIGGIQTAFNDLILELENIENEQYTSVVNQLNYISALLKKSTDYLNKRKENPAEAPELDSAIEEQIGYAWKLVELMQNGLYEENAEIVQLSFDSYDNLARKEYVDEGVWLNLSNGKIYKTKNYRPYRAAKYIKEDNTAFNVLKISNLYIYPGDQNPRIRWENNEVSERNITSEDFSKILPFSKDNFPEMIKLVKNTIKNPLMDKNPVVMISVAKSFINEETLIVEDKSGNKLIINDIDNSNTTAQLRTFLPASTENLALTVMIHNDLESGLLFAQPLSVITPNKIIRLLY